MAEEEKLIVDLTPDEVRKFGGGTGKPMCEGKEAEAAARLSETYRRTDDRTAAAFVRIVGGIQQQVEARITGTER